MIQPEPEDLPKDNPKLEIAVLRYDPKLTLEQSQQGVSNDVLVHQSPRGIFICQSEYTIDLLKKHGMEKYDTISTPMATTKLETDLQDADLARCNDDWKSTSGGIQFLGDKLVSWS
ncbi:retrovirus-related pol polyprotein from transposon TNT 1-94 [Tanacetum coccineum]